MSVERNNQPLISIIIPIYNTSAFLNDCLDSLVSQTYPNIEIICINDGSTDNSLEILNEYANQHNNIRVFDRENQGVSATRNFGIQASDGEWVMFVDSDDWLEPDAVERAFQAGQVIKADIVSFDYISEFGNVSEYRHHSTQDVTYCGKDFFLHVLGPLGQRLNEPHAMDTMSCAKLYRKTCVEGCVFEDLKHIGTSEDTLFNLNVAKKNVTALFIHYAGYHYRKTNQSATTQRYKPGLIEKWDNLYDIIEQMIDAPLEEKAFSNRIACSIIGSGINEMRSQASFFSKRSWVKSTINHRRYKQSFAQLYIKSISSPKWKLFFFCAKHHLYTGVTLLLWVMHKILTLKKAK